MRPAVEWSEVLIPSCAFRSTKMATSAAVLAFVMVQGEAGKECLSPRGCRHPLVMLDPWVPSYLV